MTLLSIYSAPGNAPPFDFDTATDAHLRLKLLVGLGEPNLLPSGYRPVRLRHTQRKPTLWNGKSPCECSFLEGTEVAVLQDYPFVSTSANQGGLQAILAYPNLTDQEKDDLLSNNYKSLFAEKLNF
jgi:hypothetical protein